MNTLSHKGTKGMHWGVRHGPPYPLHSNQVPASMKKAGWKPGRSTNESDQTKINRTAIPLIAMPALVGLGAAAVTIPAVIARERIMEKRMDDIGADSKKEQNAIEKVRSKVEKHLKDPLNNEGTVQMLDHKESIEEVVKKINPYGRTPPGTINCQSCAMAAFLRSEGYNVTAKPVYKTVYEGTNYRRIVTNLTKIRKTRRGSYFGTNRKQAEESIVKMVGKNSKGLIGVGWKFGLGGHMFNYEVKNGKVRFFDAQSGEKNVPFTTFMFIGKKYPVDVYDMSKAEFDFKKLNMVVDIRKSQ